jgi:hypothetical protein
MEENDVNWWWTPAESPDMNPIANLWHELKEYINRVAKLKTKSELVQGMLDFWATVDATKCRKYIGHLRKVLPRVIELDGVCRIMIRSTLPVKLSSGWKRMM